jgi:protein ImuB
MPPTACVDVGALPLQLLLRRHPGWQRQPVAVVSEDKPLGTVVAVNRRARAAGVRAGMRYAAALTLVSHLQAGTVSADELAAGVRQIREQLLTISPRVEWGGDGWADPGVFWLEAAGLHRHYPSGMVLADTIGQLLRGAGLVAAVVLGYTRLGTCLLARERIARGGWRPLVVADAAGERAATAALPLDRLPLEPAARDLLEKLGVATVAGFLRLPYTELLRRFGAPVAELRRTAGAASDLPVQGRDAPAPLLQRRRLTYRASDAERLLRHCRVLLDRLLDHLQQGGRAVAELQLQLVLEDGSQRHELIRPAAATSRRRLLLDLLALRLRALDLTAGVEELAIDARHTPLPAGQGELFRTSQRRDPAAAAAALASIRAEYGNAAVACAVLEEAHLPEAQYRWQPVDCLQQAHPRPPAAQAAPLVRRVLACPQPIAAAVRRPGGAYTGTVPSGTARSGPTLAAALRRRGCSGPFLVSSGWWYASGGPRHGSPPAGHVRDHQVPYDRGSAGGDHAAPPPGHAHATLADTGGLPAGRTPADRAYYFISSAGGALEWVYYDRLTRRWYRQGWVE